jgi:hypothetical protein
MMKLSETPGSPLRRKGRVNRLIPDQPSPEPTKLTRQPQVIPARGCHLLDPQATQAASRRTTSCATFRYTVCI